MAAERLTSLKNAKVLTWRSLKDRKGRKETGCFLVQGRKMTEEALASGLMVEAVLISEEHLSEFNVPEEYPVYLLPEHVFASVCDTKTPQGIAAIVRIPAPRTLQAKTLLALDGVQDPGNVGTILRTADCAGIGGILLSEQCADLYSPKVLRATMGSVFRVPTMITTDLRSELLKLRDQGFSILSSQLDGTPFYQREKLGDHFCLIIGNEGNGISPQIRAVATHRFKLPMRGGAESLNAAVAAGIMMYDLMQDCE